MESLKQEQREGTVLARLAEKEYLPILTMNDGSAVTSENWRARRAELKALLERYSYGRTPDEPISVKGEVVREGNKRTYAGKVTKLR